MSQASVSSTPIVDLDHELTKGFAARYVRRKARQLMGHTALRSQDREDIQQELLAAVLEAVPNFDPAAGDWNAFIATVVERRADRLLKRRRAEKRLGGEELASLDVLVQDADGVDVPLATQIGVHHQGRITGRYPTPDAVLVEIAHDLEVVLNSASPKTREYCEALVELSEREVAERFGVTRRTVRKHLKRLREKFVE